MTDYQGNERRASCKAHEGMVTNDTRMETKLNGIIALLCMGVGLMGYSVMWQAPNIRTDIAKEIGKLEKADTIIDNKINDTNRRVEALEKASINNDMP